MNKPVHWSALRWMRQSPLHYRYYLDNPIPMTPAMRLGWLVHEEVFQQDRSFVVYGGHRRGKAWEEFRDAHAGLEIVTGTEHALAQTIAAAVWANSEAKRVLEDGDWEQPILWTINGRACAGRPDVAGAGLTELKVTDANPVKFPWHARRMGWHVQLAWYASGLATLNGGTLPDRISIVAVEPRAPHAVTVFGLSQDCIEEGHALWRSLFERLMVCEASDEWPAYSQSVVPWDTPVSDEPVTLVMDGEEVSVE